MARDRSSVVTSIAERWRELSGENDWKGLLDPLDIDLRLSILHYGDRVAATTYAFNDKVSSDCRGFSRYPPEEFFSKLGVTKRNPSLDYTLTDFIYSRVEKDVFHWDSEPISTWCAYVAVATDEAKTKLGRRDIVVSWRGVMLNVELHKGLQALPCLASDLFGNWHLPLPFVHSGFHSLYTSKDQNSTYNKTSAREQVLAAVRKLVDQYKDEEVSITITGNSLGSALATLNAVDIAYNDYNKPSSEPKQSFPVTAIVFAGPRVGDLGFKKIYDDLKDVHVLRITNAKDPVPNFPPNFDPIPDLPPIGPIHVGENLPIDTSESKFLKSDVSPHMLDVYLHGVAGTQGSKGGFNLEVPFDLAIINKLTDGLTDEYNKNIPAEWWVEENKGMVQNDDGTYTAQFYVPDPPVVPLN
ncbi:phospholipase A1-II 1 [Manihot esculenta]|uniref:Phospholipase A1 n=1 Tax=Manihot esculenta TaxID=3983 RepID=A0A2C9U8M9_MANES|nr:phospholipase A1-II 1 [Manihot esculenta]